MRGINFSIMDEKTRDEMFNNVCEQVKGSSYAKDFELKDIVIEKFEGMGGDYQLGIVIADCVMTDFKIVAINSEDNGEISTELKIKSGILPKGLLVPKEVNISTCWKEDSMNRYKVVKQNFGEMKEMIKEGKGPKEIEEKFGIPFTEEECEKLVKMEKL